MTPLFLDKCLLSIIIQIFIYYFSKYGEIIMVAKRYKKCFAFAINTCNLYFEYLINMQEESSRPVFFH